MTDKAREIFESVCVWTDKERIRNKSGDYLDDAVYDRFYGFMEAWKYQSARIAELEAKVKELEARRSELVLELIATGKHL